MKVGIQKKNVTEEQRSSLHSLFGIGLAGVQFEKRTFIAMASSCVQTLLSTSKWT